MANLKTQFSEFRKSTPKYVQWLLLVAAFVVVLILLTLLLRGGGDKKTVVVAPVTEEAQPVLIIEPESVDWSKSEIGVQRTERFSVFASAPVKIDNVKWSREIAGLTKPRTTCTNIGQIDDKISCTINISYIAESPLDNTPISLQIEWRGASQPENMNNIENIPVTISAIDPIAQLPKTEPVVSNPRTEYTPPIREEIEAIAPSDPFIYEPSPVVSRPEPKPEPAPVVKQPAPAPVNDAKTSTVSEACSDFSFPGYGTSGQQIGWIKPTGGTYYFHPFSDRNCEKPTGVYNPDNGIISDINNRSRKIGTDAENIGHNIISNGTLPQLSNPVAPKNVNRARQVTSAELTPSGGSRRLSDLNPNFVQKTDTSMLPSSFGSQATVSSRPYDRTFVLRQYKPIPATIVSEIRAVAGETRLPVTATVDRNVYSDNGRTIVIPAGTMMLGSVVGDMPGPYKAIGRISIEWYRFVRPDGVEFNFTGRRPFSGDAQGRTGVPGRGSTDYLEQFIMPMLTAIVPAAVNMIAPISDKFINQIDLDNNTVTQTGQVRSSELAKNEVITAWNKVAQKLLVDMMDNTVPPFAIASGTRITVFSPNDLIVTCGLENGKKCSITNYDDGYAPTEERAITVGQNDPASLVGQVRSFNLDSYCDANGGVSASPSTIQNAGLDYRTVVFYCQSAQYKAINNAKQEAVYQNQQQTTYTDQNTGNKLQQGSQGYNEEVLGLKYKDDGTIQNPFQKLPVETPPATLTCEDGTPPDGTGCCTGEIYTDMGEQGFNCCPTGGGDCFPPII